jgi:D-3-phosphoglycerate dehydrogenase
MAKPMKPFSQTLFGFFGLGQIGRAVLTRLKGFGFHFLAADPGLSDADAAALGVELVDIETLLKRADIITLHAPATAITTGYFNAARLATMQPHAMIVNSARGQLIVETDLADALTNGVIAGAALDVFHVEPLPAESPLRGAPNLLLTPHAAWYSEVAIHRLQELVANDIARALRGDGPRKPVPK